MQSHQDADGWHYVQPVQKLFRLDDKTVCSIAGFASETSSAPQLSTDIAGVMADFIDGLAQNPIMDLETKLKAIGFVVGLYIDLIANRREVVLGSGTPPNSYVFEVIVAGYDADGTAKVEKLTLTPRVAEAADGHRYWSHETLLETASLGRGLVSVLGGIRDYSLQVLNSPEQFADGSAIREYAESKARDGGASLSLDEMAALAKEMAGQAARKTPFVGGPDQIAVLSGGKISSFDQPPFPRQSKGR
jgi:20S proteasome alpha/beta subunit